MGYFDFTLAASDRWSDSSASLRSPPPKKGLSLMVSRPMFVPRPPWLQPSKLIGKLGAGSKPLLGFKAKVITSIFNLLKRVSTLRKCVQNNKI